MCVIGVLVLQYIFISMFGIRTFVSFIFPNSSQSITLCIAFILESMSANYVVLPGDMLYIGRVLSHVF